jgi:PAS domain S-box-containing protein
LILGTFSYTKVYHDETKAVFDQKKSTAFLIAGIIHQELETAVNVGVSLATRTNVIEEIQQGEWSNAINHLKGSLGNFPIFNRIILYSPNGIIQADMPSTTPSVIGQSRADMEWYKVLQKRWIPGVSGIYQRVAKPNINVVSILVPIRVGADISPITVPVSADTKQVIGILQLQLNLNIFQELIKGTEMEEEEIVYVVDQYGHMVYHPQMDFRQHIIDLSSVPAVAQLLKGISGVKTYYNAIEKEERVSAYQRVSSFGWGVVVAQSVRTAFAERNQNLLTLVCIFTAMALLTGIAVLLFISMMEDRKKFEDKMMKINEELKQGSFNVEESRKFLSNILNALGDPVFVKDRKHRWVLLNDAFCQLMGRSREELIGKSDYEFFPQAEADVFWEKDELVFKTTETNVNEEDFSDSQGVKHAILTKKVVYKDGNGVEYIVGIITEISQLKKVMDDLQESKKQLEETRIFLDSIIENIPNMVFVKDAKELKFVRLNKAGERLIGISREDMIGKSDYDFFPKEQADFFTEKDRETLKQGQAFDIPEENIHTKRGERVLHTKKVTIVDDKGRPKYLLGISEDVTEIRLSESKLKETLMDLEKFNQLAVGREERMIELKREINALAKELGRKPPYNLSFLEK